MKIVENCNNNGYPSSNNLDDLMQYFLSRHRQKILDHYASQGIDANTFEGGIDWWFGHGSVMCQCLNGFSLSFSEAGTVLELY